MSEADVMTRHDLKAGFSTICRRGEHKTCATAKARCDCPCHGAPQRPPAPKETVVPEATVTPLSPMHRCDECGYETRSANGLKIHRGRAHEKRTAAPAPKPKAKAEPVKPDPPASDHQVLAVVAQAYHDLCDADVATCIESADFILAALFAAGFSVEQA